MPATVTIYTRRFCGYCTAAVGLLRKKGVRFEEIDAGFDGKTRRWLEEVTGRQTVPQIFIDGQPIGGYANLRRLDERGDLDRMLAGSAADPPAPRASSAGGGN